MEEKKVALEATKNDDANVSRPSNSFTQIVDGFPLPALMPVACYRSALSYKPRPGDIFVATYPKCGTTWMQYILLLLFRKGKPITSMPEFVIGSPYLEMMGSQLNDTLPRPIALKTHLPYHLAPRSEAAKYICITKNPKDCCVSYFHHMKNQSTPEFGFNGTFDEFFELFISGNIDYGDYFDHVLGWYEHRNDDNVLFLTYEEMKEDPKETILRIASFIDDKLYAEPLKNDSQLLENILKNSSFEAMKQNINQQVDSFFSTPPDDILKLELPTEMKELLAKISQMFAANESARPKSINFIRKGIIGDWHNYFSEEQNRRLEEKFAEKMKDTDLAKLWRKYM